MSDSMPARLGIARGFVTLRKCRNVLEVSHNGNDPLQEAVRQLLEPELSYTYVQRHYGAAAFCSETGRRRSVTTIERQMFRYDQYGRLITNFGFYRRIVDVCRQAGWHVAAVDLFPIATRSNPLCYQLDWQNVLENFEFRPKQDECLARIATAPCGVVHAVTGFGKMAILAMTCLLFPNAKIDVCTYARGLAIKIREYLTRYLPNVGLVGAGKRKPGDRITVYTRDSLHHSDKSADLLLVDEGHLCLADQGSSELAKYQDSRNIVFTATPSGRPDGTDKRMEALFGQTIFEIPYPEAVSLGLVVPIEVEWSDVRLSFNPIENVSDSVERLRLGIWTNQGRNSVVAAAARRWADRDEQVLILCDFVEHAVHLKSLLPDFTLVYANLAQGDRSSYVRQGLLASDEPRMTPALREHYRHEFEAGRLRRSISTVWGTGVDAPSLSVVVRAAGAASEIDDQQEPGRVARRSEAGKEVKECGVLCDFGDQFDRRMEKRADGRLATYRRMGWRNYKLQGGVEVSLD